MPLKTLANTIKWNDVANQQAVEEIASKQHINLNSNANIPTPDAKLLHLTGDQFATAYIDTEIRDQTNALHAYQKAQKDLKNDPNVELYIEQSIPVVQTHLKEAQILKQHEGQITAQK
jgi:predicted outer membrane protein